MYTSDIEFQQRGGSVGRSIFTHEARAEPRFPRIPDHSLPFPGPPIVTRRCIAIGARFFRDILDSITENLVTLSTSDRISSPHLSPLHNSHSDVSPGVGGGTNDNSRILRPLDNASFALIQVFLIDFRRYRTKAAS